MNLAPNDQTGYTRINNVLSSIYYDANNPAGFSSAHKLYKYANKIDNSISLTNVKDWLSGEYTYTLHKYAKRNFKRNRVLVKETNEQWEADLEDMQQFKQDNDGHRYILTIIDCFSKYAYAYALKDKSSKSVVNIFKKIFNNTVPERIYTDNGKEFVNSQFKRLMDDFDIVHFTSKNSEIKCSIIERFNRTLKSKMFKYFTSVKNYRYIDVLDKFLYAYNHSVHRSIKMRPVDVENFEKDAFFNLYGKASVRDLIKTYINSKLSIGDYVRIKYQLSSFDKRYLPNWSKNVYKIVNISSKHQKPLYELLSKSGIVLEKKFYPEEVQKINIYKVE